VTRGQGFRPVFASSSTLRQDDRREILCAPQELPASHSPRARARRATNLPSNLCSEIRPEDHAFGRHINMNTPTEQSDGHSFSGNFARPRTSTSRPAAPRARTAVCDARLACTARRKAMVSPERRRIERSPSEKTAPPDREHERETGTKAAWSHEKTAARRKNAGACERERTRGCRLRQLQRSKRGLPPATPRADRSAEGRCRERERDQRGSRDRGDVDDFVLHDPRRRRAGAREDPIQECDADHLSTSPIGRSPNRCAPPEWPCEHEKNGMGPPWRRPSAQRIWTIEMRRELAQQAPQARAPESARQHARRWYDVMGVFDRDREQRSAGAKPASKSHAVRAARDCGSREERANRPMHSRARGRFASARDSRARHTRRMPVETPDGVGRDFRAPTIRRRARRRTVDARAPVAIAKRGLRSAKHRGINRAEEGRSQEK